MCGIAGLLGPGSAQADLLTRMGGALIHRGPDDGGIWADPEAGIGLSHRRLSIVDLSVLGHQPMESSDGRWILCFNGEIYNHVAIRAAMARDGTVSSEGWRGHSDTETLVGAIRAYGLDAAVEMSVGMFAFALWDRSRRELHLVRDRLGEKPLYYGRAGKDFAFASELKSFRAHPQFEGRIDPGAVSALLSFTAIPAPMSIYAGVFKQQPGTILTVSSGFDVSLLTTDVAIGDARPGIRYRRYWDYRDVVETGARSPYASSRDALDAIETALTTAVAGQSIADVPIGAFLSGGIDSSLVAALYQKGASRPIKTYTIGFTEPAFDESPQAAAVARHLGCDHHELIVSPDDARDVIPLLPDIYDEPFADSSQIPTYLVSRFARESVTVALTGDGGDELFAGYNRHVLGSRLWASLSRLPPWMRRAGAGALSGLPHQVWSMGLSNRLRGPQFGRKVKKGLGLAANARGLEDIYASFVDEWHGQGPPLTGSQRWHFDAPPIADDVGLASRLAYWDACSYLPDDILVKVDRASMAVSLETRVPFLDQRVADVAARVPDTMKVGPNGGKLILRQLLGRYLPRELFERPKTGFGIPVGEWLRGPLRDWAEDLLGPDRLRRDEWLDAAEVRRVWQEHLAGTRDATAALWAILMFNAWLDRR